VVPELKKTSDFERRKSVFVLKTIIIIRDFLWQKVKQDLKNRKKKDESKSLNLRLK
jgi:hypothetical protein